MSDNANNHVIQNSSSVTDRQSAANTISNNNLNINHFNHNIIIPVMQLQPPINPLSTIMSLLPPPPPPAAFQLQPKLSASAPAFTPINTNYNNGNPMHTPSALNVQGYKTTTKDTVSNQLKMYQNQLNESSAKLQILSIQLNSLQTLTQQSPSIEALQQYQSVYQQYSFEFSNMLLLNQYINNLNALALSTNTAHKYITNTSNNDTRLQTIVEEGENENVDDIASIAGVKSGYSPKQAYDDDEGEGLHYTTNNSTANKTTHTSTANNATETLTDTDRVFGERLSESDKIKTQIGGILNQMSAANFDKLSREMRDILKMTDIAFMEFSKNEMRILSTEEISIAQKAQSKALIKLILKCILEHAVSASNIAVVDLFARLCHSLYVYAQQKKDELKQKLLRKQLLNLCHWTFKKARNAQKKGEFKKIMAMIGKLYEYGLISWHVILGGIFDELLPPQTPLDIEAVCALLKTSGRVFDDQHYNEMNVMMDRLSKCGQRYNFKTRAFIREIQDIRCNAWNPNISCNKTSNNNRWNSNNNNNGRWKGNNHKYNKYRYNRNRKHEERPQVEFIRDVTLPDRSHYAPNKILTKTWAMKNSGDKSWGDKVELVYFKGDECLSVKHRYPVMNVAGGQEVEISVTIKTPQEPARYCTYFRLEHNGKFFGPRVWVDIIVNKELEEKTIVNPCVEETNNIVLQC